MMSRSLFVLFEIENPGCVYVYCKYACHHLLLSSAREHGGYKLVKPEEQELNRGAAAAAAVASDEEEHDLWVKGQGHGQYVNLQ